MVSVNWSSASRARLVRSVTSVAIAAVLITACSDSTSPVAPGFLGGTSDNHEIGVVLNSTGNSLVLFQLGSPTTTEQIALGTSSTITPTGFAVRGRKAVIPLGNAASVALVDLQTSTIKRYFLFHSGNATGAAFVNDTTVIVANTNENYIGRFTFGQASDTIRDTVTAGNDPTAIVMAGNRAMVISSNLDENYAPLGNGIVTAVNPATMQVIGSVQTGGANSNDAALGPDGLLYVVNTSDYVGQGSLTIIDPATLHVVMTVPNIGVGPGDISIDANGLAYISGFSTGTVVWNTVTRQFVRDALHPVCAPLASGGCRGAFASTANAAGDLYQLFFGSTAQSLAPYVFVYKAGTFALSDSISAGAGPAAIAIQKF